MATQKAQRIGIWIIAIVLLVGTLGSFAVLVLGNANSAKDQTANSELMDAYDEYQKAVAAQATELSAKYYDEFSQYASAPKAFDATGISEVGKVDLKVGNGADITSDSTFTAYYIGWNPTGKVSDQSIDGETLKAPFTASPGSVITGWTEGVAGMKVGGVRELTIPADKAYGATGSGEDIPANTPLKFILMIIPTPAEIPIPEALLKASQQ